MYPQPFKRVYQTKGILTKPQRWGCEHHHQHWFNLQRFGNLDACFFFSLNLIFHLSHVLTLDEFYPADMLLAILPRTVSELKHYTAPGGTTSN